MSVSVRDRLAAAAAGDAQAISAEHLGNFVAARRMARRDDCQQRRDARRDPLMGGGDDLLLAGMRAGREPDRRAPPIPRISPSSASSAGQRRERRL